MSYMAVIDRFSWLPALKKHVIKAWPGTGLPSLVVQVAEWHHHSASCHLLVFPRFQLYTYGHRTFTVSGPTTRNLLCDSLHEPDMQTPLKKPNRGEEIVSTKPGQRVFMIFLV